MPLVFEDMFVVILYRGLGNEGIYKLFCQDKIFELFQNVE